MSRLLLVLLTAAITLGAASGAHAHKVNIFAYAEDGMVHTQSYFADGGPASGSTVTATGPSGTVIAEGKTDEQGAFSFNLAGNGPITLRLNASQGHGNEYTLSAEEVAEASGGKQAAKATAADTPAPEDKCMPAPQPVIAQDVPMSPATFDEEALRRVVREELDRKLTPVNRQLLDIRKEFEKPSLKDTISGIGYIFGILGIILYMRSRRR